MKGVKNETASSDNHTGNNRLDHRRLRLHLPPRPPPPRPWLRPNHRGAPATLAPAPATETPARSPPARALALVLEVVCSVAYVVCRLVIAKGAPSLGTADYELTGMKFNNEIRAVATD